MELKAQNKAIQDHLVQMKSNEEVCIELYI